MIAPREPWYAECAGVLADESEYMLGLCEYNHIIMEQALADRLVEIDLHALEGYYEGLATDWDVTDEVPY